ncbi:hypothetical protein [Paraglaciecola chathamensis]|uniref:Uncharacterized protein n=3 Tax=Paraglaciecola chathamensis TaxID=368405 RepID=A0A8H9LXJ4_9ALTE|nr:MULTISPECIES: hypothetical protein [Paraglaciecola]MBN23708.1 hypothetical protein [Alteromonadaceae bacterium]MBJ2139008.1 hypothetical protein [Paraglaciecola chathamensis]MBU3018191.1 hypothetical protein [Paraglaciecola agarilytica]MDO6561703.1 hypothetical protein [Paraglaciecola chathamensis]MDO6841742.1 hypothetical protein [Paraglaciecola chathamensis]
MTVLIILGVLLVALLIVVPLLERSSFRLSNEQMSKMSRWILPLLVVMVIVQLIMHFTSN